MTVNAKDIGPRVPRSKAEEIRDTIIEVDRIAAELTSDPERAKQIRDALAPHRKYLDDFLKQPETLE